MLLGTITYLKITSLLTISRPQVILAGLRRYYITISICFNNHITTTIIIIPKNQLHNYSS